MGKYEKLEAQAITHIIKIDLLLLVLIFFLPLAKSLQGSLEFNYNHTNTCYNVSPIYISHIVF